MSFKKTFISNIIVVTKSHRKITLLNSDIAGETGTTRYPEGAPQSRPIIKEN